MRKPTGFQPRFRILLPMLLATTIVIDLILPFIPPSEERQRQCIAQLEYESCYTLNVDGKPLLYLNDLGQGTMGTDVSTSPDSVKWQRVSLKGCWTYRYLFLPICRGHLTVSNPDYGSDSLLTALNSRIDTIIGQNIRQLEADSLRLRHISRQLDYYLDIHNVSDEGYNAIASLAAQVVEIREKRNKTLGLLRNIGQKQTVELQLHQRYTLLDKGKRIPCELLEHEYESDVYKLQAAGQWMPDSARSIFHNPVTSDFVKRVIAAKKQPRQKTEYHGERKNGVADGHGILIDHEHRQYYDGMWSNGERKGFGFAIDSVGILRVGEWSDNRYRGERLTYTTERIYGIDISRFQHDIGKRHYPIDWDKIRITHLGTISKKRVKGAVDYPVSFVYIKSTEGKSIHNRYYKADYKAARSRGFHVGSYHFFSTKTSATEQADYFMRMSNFHKGDFPPMLDVEPYPSQINEMGGAEVLFNRVRTWLSIIEKRTGTRPILYVNQAFVNKYLPMARDIIHNYRVWIARYGEYKPDVRLAIWQLSPDGRVTGIHGDVDINVFNGYQDQYQDFLESQLIR